jgi:CheY-like chemotaxis protein
MTKIMLVEDDNNLREIYEARLAAEGYDIVSAQDGEAALALAAKEHPDLIITDVMMPKISGFEMLDILRNTENLRDVKVIMLTALGQAEDNARAGALGADRYLVKSQVTLEDIIKATHDVLEGTDKPAATTAHEQTPTETIPMTVSTPVVELLPEPSLTPATADEPSLTTPPVAPEPSGGDSSDAPVNSLNDAADPIQVIEPPQLPQPDLSSSSTTTTDAEAVVASVAPSSQEESQISTQIDQFLEASPKLPEEPESEYDKDEATPDMGQLSIHEPEATAPPDEPDAEYDKDAAVPDYGQMTVQDTEEPASSVATPQVISPTPGYPSQSFELPNVTGAAVEPTTDSSDSVVSDAISNMVATTNGTDQPVSQPTTNADQPLAPAEQTSHEATGGSVHSRVIAPLGLPPVRPDINQLLSIEEAKNAATQAASVVQPTAGTMQPPQAPDAQPWQQPPANPNQGIDPNSISL